MTATADQLSAAAPRVLMLTLEWGNSSVSRYAVSDYDISYDSNTFTAAPAIEISDLRLGGDLSPESVELTLGADISPFSTFVEESSHARIRCTFAVADPTDTDGTYREFFFGYLRTAEAEDADDELLYKFVFEGIKAQLERRLGFLADNYCQVWLGHPLCQVDVASIQVSGEVTEIGTDGVANRVTIDFGMSPPSYDDARWRTGVITYDGLALGILASLGGGEFDLEFPPPSSWDSQTVTAEPGCDGLASTCRDVYSNQSNFVGFGLDMPDKYPLTEVQ